MRKATTEDMILLAGAAVYAQGRTGICCRRRLVKEGSSMRLFLIAALSTVGCGGMAAEPAAPQVKLTPTADHTQINMAQWRQLEGRLPQGSKLLPDGDILLPDGQRITPQQVISPAAPATCYFIRNLRPVTQEDLAAKPSEGVGTKPAAPRLIPLQARVAGVVNRPVCAEAAQPIHAAYAGNGKRE